MKSGRIPGRKPGRPRKPRDEHGTQIWPSFPNHEYDRLAALAESQGVDVNTLVRRIVSEWLAGQGQTLPVRDTRDVKLYKLMVTIARWRNMPKPKHKSGLTNVKAWTLNLLEMVKHDLAISDADAFMLLKYYNAKCKETGHEDLKIWGID